MKNRGGICEKVTYLASYRPADDGSCTRGAAAGPARLPQPGAKKRSISEHGARGPRDIRVEREMPRLLLA